MNIKDIPWYNRPWHKIKEKGVEALDDGELLSTIFIRGNKKLNALELSNKLLNRFNLNRFEELSFEELKGILEEDTKVFQIISLGELFKRYSKLKRKGYSKIITSPEDIFKIYNYELRNKKKEELHVVCLDSKNRIIKKQLIAIGTLNSSLVHPREIFMEVIKASSNSFILVHNHPSGDPSPSKEDLAMTQKIHKVSQLVGIKLLDHIIIGYDKWASLKDFVI